jgi:hypothetical protein
MLFSIPQVSDTFYSFGNWKLIQHKFKKPKNLNFISGDTYLVSSKFISSTVPELLFFRSFRTSFTCYPY